MYSSIKKKKCKCGCDKWPAIGYNGYAGKSHMPEEMQKLDKYNKKPVALRRQSIKSQLSRNLHGINDTSKVEQWEWFVEIRKLMTGRCKHCSGKSCKDDDKLFHYSIAHILPKAYFPSVAMNEYNWVELCFWGNNCHGNMDNKMLDLIDMNCWDEIVTKFAKMYPSIAKEEIRRIPAVLMQYLDVET